MVNEYKRWYRLLIPQPENNVTFESVDVNSDGEIIESYWEEGNLPIDSDNPDQITFHLGEEWME